MVKENRRLVLNKQDFKKLVSEIEKDFEKYNIPKSTFFKIVFILWTLTDDELNHLSNIIDEQIKKKWDDACSPDNLHRHGR